MKLLMISGDSSIVEGKEGAFYNTLKGFSRFWERIDVICPSVNKPLKLSVFNNVFFHPLPPGHLLAPLFIFNRGREVIKKIKPDLIIAHAYGFQLMSLGAYLLSRKTGLPIVLEVMHIGGYPRAASFREWLEKIVSKLFIGFMARRADAFRVINKAEGYPMLISLGVPTEKIKIIYAFYIDQGVFNNRDDKGKKFDLIFVGRLAANKNLPLLLNIFQKVAEEIPQVSLVIVGSGLLERWLKRQIISIKNVNYFRSVPTLKDVADLYRQSRIVVCCSTAEGGPRFVVEAMACGLPAVSTPVGLMKEIIKDGENGFLAKNWSEEEMARAIINLLRSPELYKKCSENAISSVARFEYNKTISEYALAYQKLIKELKNKK